MGKQKIVYVADDGSEFESEAELQNYEFALSMSKEVEEFLTENEVAKPTAGMLRKQIPAFLLWKQNKSASA